MRRAAIIAASLAILPGCASQSHPYTQLPVGLDVFVVQNDRVHFPHDVLIGPHSDITAKAVIPGDPWSEAAKVVAQCISDCFKWGYKAGENGAIHEVGWSTTSYRLLSFRWGNSIDVDRVKMMWAAYTLFIAKMPDTIPMYQPNEDHGEALVREAGTLKGWSEKPTVYIPDEAIATAPAYLTPSEAPR